MASAVSVVTSGQMSQRKACSVFDLPTCMLHTRVTKKTRSGDTTVLPLHQQRKQLDNDGNRVFLGIGLDK